MAEQYPIYSCPCCTGSFTIVQGKLIAVSDRAGEYTEQRDNGDVVEVHRSAPGRSSGLVVETQLSPAKPAPNVRQRKRRGKMQEPGVATPFKPANARKDTTWSENTEMYGENAFQDCTADTYGMSGRERHMDAALQHAYESDLSQRGFNSSII